MQCASDGIAEMEQMAKRMVAEEKAAKAISIARAQLVLGKGGNSRAAGVFFSTLALRFKTEVDWSIDTMATDGKSLFYNPDFTNGLTQAEVLGVVVHETMHASNRHFARQGQREHERFNEACDLAINFPIEEAGFTLPKSRLMPGEGRYSDLPKGLSAEEYYNLLPPDPPSGEDGDGDGDGNGQGEGGNKQGKDKGGCGTLRKAGDGSPAAQAEAAADWECAVVQAETAARTRGTLPAGLARMVDEVVNPPVNWRIYLREFLAARSKDDYSWTKPNRRFIHDDLYLPGLDTENLGEVILVVDCSGSVGQKELGEFANECNAILANFKCTATIVYHDAVVCGTEEWEPSDGPLTLKPMGGGGTSHAPVWDWVRNHHGNPSCIVALTDLYTTYGVDPGVPLLWAVTGGNRQTPPFGKVVYLNQ